MEISTFFGILGVIANILWPLAKTRKLLLFTQVFASMLMGIHFFLLDAFTGATLLFLAGVQGTLAIPLEDHPKFKLVYVISILLTPVICIYTWQGYPSIFSSIGLMFFCIGNLQVSTMRLRILLILCVLMWVGHNALVASYPALVSNFMTLSASFYGLYREIVSNKKDTHQTSVARSQ